MTSNDYIFLKILAHMVIIRQIFPQVVPLCIVAITIFGCSHSQQVEKAPEPNEELALKHFLEGSLLDQKADYAKAILEYQDALHYKLDPATYHAIAKDYSLIGKHELAIQNGREAVHLSPNNRTYHETLADIYVSAFDLDNAIKEYREIIRVDSLYRTAWLNLGRLYQLQNPAKALEV